MAPLLDGYINLDRQKQEYVPDVKKQFTTELKARIEECLEYNSDLEIIRIVDEDATPFAGSNASRMASEQFRNAYAVSYDHTFVVIQDEFDRSRQALEGIADGPMPPSPASGCIKISTPMTNIELLNK